MAEEQTNRSSSGQEVVTRHNGVGCAFGQRLEKEVGEVKVEHKETIGKLEKRLGQVLWALVAAAITFGTMTLTLIFTRLVP